MRNNYLFSEKVVVDSDNVFSVRGIDFVIPEDNLAYKVANKYSESENYDNESNMTSITAVLGRDMKFYFYDENGTAVEKVTLKK